MTARALQAFLQTQRFVEIEIVNARHQFLIRIASRRTEERGVLLERFMAHRIGVLQLPA